MVAPSSVFISLFFFLPTSLVSASDLGKRNIPAAYFIAKQEFAMSCYYCSCSDWRRFSWMGHQGIHRRTNLVIEWVARTEILWSIQTAHKLVVVFIVRRVWPDSQLSTNYLHFKDWLLAEFVLHMQCVERENLRLCETHMASTGGSVVEFSPATREARVRFPASAEFHYFVLARH